MEPSSQSWIRNFPWMLFQKWAIATFLLILAFSFVFLAGLRLLIYGEYTGITLEAFVFLMGSLLFLLLVWWQFRFLYPVIEILKKGRALVSGDEIGDVWHVNPYREDKDDEWGDLTNYLNQIHSKVRESHEKLTRERQGIQTLVHSSGDAILAVDREGVSVFFNSRLELLVGRERLSQKNVRVSEIFREPDILDGFNHVLKSGAPERMNVQFVPSNETLPHFFSLNLVPLLKQGSGDVYGAMGIFHDVTELKRAELIKIDFVANVSHELRTPLTSVKGYLQVIESDLKSGRMQDVPQQLGVVSANVNRLISLVHDLLDLSALETGADLNLEDVDVGDMTESVIAQLDLQRRAKKIKIETNYEVGSIRADRKRVEQVLVNLIQNAIKYIPENGLVMVKWEEPDQGRIILRIKDNGPGIASEHLPRIFERFYRVDAARSRDLGGTGLGLAIVKHILQRHGGSISVTSELGRGTEFICKFPSLM